MKNVSFSIEEKLLDQFKKVCKENAINQSAWITLQIKKLVENSK